MTNPQRNGFKFIRLFGLGTDVHDRLWWKWSPKLGVYGDSPSQWRPSRRHEALGPNDMQKFASKRRSKRSRKEWEPRRVHNCTKRLRFTRSWLGCRIAVGHFVGCFALPKSAQCQIPISIASSPANSAGHQDLHTPPTSCALPTTGGTSACLSEVPTKTTVVHKAAIKCYNQVPEEKLYKIVSQSLRCLCYKCGKTPGICQLLDMASKTHQQFALKTSTKLEAHQSHPMTAWQHVPNNLVCHQQPTIWTAHEG